MRQQLEILLAEYQQEFGVLLYLYSLLLTKVSKSYSCYIMIKLTLKFLNKRLNITLTFSCDQQIFITEHTCFSFINTF